MIFANVSGIQKTALPKANVSDVWKDVANIFEKQNDGSWKPTFTFDWEIGSWSTCSVTCGGGTQNRTVKCKRNDGLYVDDAFCSTPKPALSQTCNTQACTTGDCRYSESDNAFYLWQKWQTYNATTIGWGGSWIPNNSTVHPLGLTSYNYNGYRYTPGALKLTMSGTYQWYEVCRTAI